MTSRRIAVLHEWFAPLGGSEQVTLEMADCLGADLWALWDEDPGGPGNRPRESRLAEGPSWVRRRPLAMALTPWVWRSTTTPVYDVVVTSSHALGHTARLPSSPDAAYLSYVHSPARYVWTPELDARGAAWWLTPARAAIRHVDRRMSRHVDSIAVNSEEVRRRVRRAWGRDSIVINPPIDTDFYRSVPLTTDDLPPGVPPQTYLLAAGRWVPYKRVPLAVRIADRAGLPIVVAGGGPDEPAVLAEAERAGIPVHIVRDPSRIALRALYSGAIALVFPGHEDFGMIPVEAMACGTPVVALDRGGARETIDPGHTGFLCPDDVSAFAEAVQAAERLARGDAIRDHALRFSREEFRRKVRTWVDSST